jgi:hypothetical protein
MGAKYKMKSLTLLLTALLLVARPLTLHAAEPNPLATAKYRWNMSGGSKFKLSVAVKTDVALAGIERVASLVRGGVGIVAEFAGGFLALADSRLRKVFHFKGELLLSNWITTSLDKSYPGIFGNGKSLWIGPLKKVIVDQDNHLKLA